MKISDLIIGLIIISLLVALLTLVIAGYNESYPKEDYDSNTLESYNKLENLTSHAEQIKSDVGGIKQDRGVFDILGGFFISAYNSILLTASSIDTFDEMANSAARDLNLGKVGFYLKTAFVSIIIVLIFVGVIMSAMTKWPV